MSELSGDEVGHGDEVLDAAIAACPSASFLKRTIHRFDTTIVLACLETVENARKMPGDRSAEAFERFESAPTGPAEPALQQRLCLIRRVGCDVDGPQRLFDPPGPCRLEVRALQPVHGFGLLDRPVGRLLVQPPAAALEFGCGFDLRTSHLVQSRAAQSNDVEAVETDLGAWKVLGGAGLKGAAHVHADMGDRGRLATMLGEVGGEFLQRGLVPARRGKQQALCVKVIENRDVRLAALACGLIDADGANPGMTLPGTRLAHMMVDHAPQSATAHAQQPTRRQDRHGRCQHQRQGLKQKREAASLTRPRHWNLRHLAAIGTGHARHLGMQMRFVLKEIQMAPRARQAIVKRLRRCPTSRAGMTGCAEPHLEVDPSRLWLEDDFLDLPRSNEAQSLGEQRFNHGEPVAKGKTAIVLHAEGGRLPSSARRKRKRGGGDVKGSASPGLRPPLTSPPPQTVKPVARSTRNDIEPEKAVSAYPAQVESPEIPIPKRPIPTPPGAAHEKLATAIAITAALAAAATHQYLHASTDPHQSDLQSKLHAVEKTLSETQQDLLGYTTFTQYLEVTKKAISGRTKFLAARIDRNYVHVEHINRSALGIKSDATIILNYAVEYSVGYDLSPESFSVSGDATGITVTLKKPELVASPAIGAISHEIPGKGLLIDEKEQVIALQQHLTIAAEKQGNAISMEEAVIALCERKLGEFLRDFLAKQPNVRAVPMITFAYR
jgi:hypothetical protein